MEDQYTNEARIAASLGQYRIAADKYVQAVQAATNKLSDIRIMCFMSYYAGFMIKPETSLENVTYGYLAPEDKDIKTLNSFLDNPDEPTVIRANAAMALGTIHNADELGRRDVELAAIYYRRGIQECVKASIEERNRMYQFHSKSHGETLDRLRDTMTQMLNKLEFPETAYSSQLASLQYPGMATSYGIFDKGILAELIGDHGTSLDHLARRLTVGGVTCDCCGKERDHTDLLSLLCCNRCHLAYYCSADCQCRQWKEGGHKKACRKPGEFREGDAIRLDGLKATPQFNNGFGLALRREGSNVNEDVSWAVQTNARSSINMLSVKESNMRRIRPADIR